MACDPNFSPDGRSIFNTDPPQELIWIGISPIPGEKEWEHGPGFKDPLCLFGKHILVRRTIYRNHNFFLIFQLFKLSQGLHRPQNRRPRQWWTFSTSIRMISRWKYFDCARSCELIFLPFVNFYWQQISLQAYLAIHSFGNLVIHPSPYSQKVG